MAKNKKVSRKVKQVASRAKSAPRTDTNPPVVVSHDPVVVIDKIEAEPVSNVVVHGDIEFAVESTEQQRKNALERSKKVDLKAEIKSMIAVFRNEINTKLTRLTERIEDQLKPMVKTVADVAVARAEFELQFADFEDRLSATLNLNDELEPIEIAEMFGTYGTELDEEMSTYNPLPKTEDEELELLTEATDSMNKPSTEVVN